VFYVTKTYMLISAFHIYVVGRTQHALLSGTQVSYIQHTSVRTETRQLATRLYNCISNADRGNRILFCYSKAVRRNGGGSSKLPLRVSDTKQRYFQLIMHFRLFATVRVLHLVILMLRACTAPGSYLITRGIRH
jgi:hypothetical protein